MIRAVLFDWNGVIVDDAPIRYKGLSAVFRACGTEPPSFAEYCRTFPGPPYYPYYWDRGVTLSKEEIDRVYYPTVYGEEEPITQEFPAVLRGLVIRRLVTGIVSAEDQKRIAARISRENLFAHFRFLRGDVREKVQAIREFCSCFKFHPREVIFVDDLPSDILDGRGANVIAVAYMGPFDRRELLLEARPEHLIRNLTELFEIIQHWQEVRGLR